MIITDTLSNLFSKIKNGFLSKKTKIIQQNSKQSINVLNILEIIQVNQVLMVLLLIIIILEIMILLINILINNIYTNKSAICIKIK